MRLSLFAIAIDIPIGTKLLFDPDIDPDVDSDFYGYRFS